MKKPNKKEIQLIFTNYSLKAFSLKKYKNNKLYLNSIYPVDAEYYVLKYDLNMELVRNIEITRLYRQKGNDVEPFDICLHYNWDKVLDSADRDSFEKIETYIISVFMKYPTYIDKVIPSYLSVLFER